MAQTDRAPAAGKPTSLQQLDKMIVVAPPRIWIAIVGAVLIIAALIIWSVTGVMPVNLEADGIFVSAIGTGGIYAPASGIVVEVDAWTDLDVERGDVLAVLDTNADGCSEESDKVEITAELAGTIQNFAPEYGAYVTIGQELGRIRYSFGDFDYRQVVLYVPVNEAAKVREGMEVMVYPSTVSKQEYGHMLAEVIAVDSYVTSTEDMTSVLGDTQLVSMFTADGPVAQVYCELRTDESTKSGYYWSTAKGADVELNEGTLLTADIVLEEKAPITILFPYLGKSTS